jgi:hypothetical protein
MRSLGIVTALAVALGGTAAVAAPASAAAPPLRFHGAQYDSPGTDTRSNASRNAEWVSLINSGSSSVNLRGWTVRDAAGHVYKFGSISIPGRGGRLWLHTGSGTTKAPNAHWGSGNYIWNNTGDTAILRNAAGRQIDACSWTNKAGRTWVGC